MVDPARLTSDDLWPCIWALSKVIEKQFTGKIFICAAAGKEDLPSPCALSERVSFVDRLVDTAITFCVGASPMSTSSSYIVGDARGSSISFGQLLDAETKAHPISGFALAGYLGFAALAVIAGIPQFRNGFIQNQIDLPLVNDHNYRFAERLTFIGLGQLGQAYLSLLFFLNKSIDQEIILVDKDPFEGPNYNTQILLDEKRGWENKLKAKYLESMLQKFGWDARGEVAKLEWGWSRPIDHSPKVVVGLDKFETRRIVMSAGYEWMFEAGLGTTFLEPKISWHSMPADSRFSYLFADRTESKPSYVPETDLEDELRRTTPGGCGLVTYKDISASAPSMGLVAAAYVWSEILSHQSADKPVKGNACLWSPLLPSFRTDITEERHLVASSK